MNATYATLRERLDAGLALLPDKPEETTDTTLHALWHTAAGAPKSAEAARDATLPTLDADARAKLDALIERRLSGVPLAHVTGRQRFLDAEMLAGPAALVPRRETELLARAAIDLAADVARDRAPLVVDVCTGSGNVALAVARRIESARVFGADISEDAVDLARRNAEWLKLDARVEFRAGDLLAPFDVAAFHAAVDVLTCNPPYISSGKVGQMAAEIAAHEPRLAFDGGPFGVSILMRLLQDAPRFLRAGGVLAFEVGLGQGPAMAKRLKANAAYDDVRELADEHGDVRALIARRATENA